MELGLISLGFLLFLLFLLRHHRCRRFCDMTLGLKTDCSSILPTGTRLHSLQCTIELSFGRFWANYVQPGKRIKLSRSGIRAKNRTQFQLYPNKLEIETLFPSVSFNASFSSNERGTHVIHTMCKDGSSDDSHSPQKVVVAVRGFKTSGHRQLFLPIFSTHWHSHTGVICFPLQRSTFYFV